MTRMIADTHLHLYPSWDFAAAAAALVANLARHGAGVRAAFLVERHGLPVFGALPLRLPSGIEIHPGSDGSTRLLSVGAGPPVYLFPGRQVVCAERLEVLALAVDADLPDGLPAVRTVGAILEAGGVPVLPWSPGKWLGARRRIVLEILRRQAPGTILAGDTALRPAGFPEPAALRAARRRGIAVIAGSDPFPLPGEERYAGTYLTVFEGQFDPGQPLESARRFLRSAAPTIASAGRRCSLAAAAVRWARYMIGRRGQSAGGSA